MCQQCQTKPVYEFTNKRKVCGNCFVKWFEKKVFYTIRKFEMLRQGDVVGYVFSSPRGGTPKNIQKNIFTRGNFRSSVLENVLKMVAEKGRIELTTGGRFDKFAEPTTIDLTAYKIVSEIIKGNVKKLNKSTASHRDDQRPRCTPPSRSRGRRGKYLFKTPNCGVRGQKFIEPLCLFLDKEIELYAKLKKLRFKKNSLPSTQKKEVSKGQKNIIKFINELEIKHPEIKRAIVNGFLRINN